MAYAKICTAAGGQVRSQVKMFRSDSGDASTDQSEMALRSMCPDVDITGVETVEMKHVSEGNRIRTYVLVALPLGDKNVLKSAKDAAARAPEAFRELDAITKEQNKTPAVSEPVPSTDQKNQTISVVNPDGTTQSIGLLQVENEEYKRRRAEALEKPGAVIGQYTLQAQ
jgi:aspartate 1-decarboxylase